MPFSGGQPPGPNAGEISALTGALRPSIGLTPEQCVAARQLRRRGEDVSEISRRLGATETQVREALATLRTRNRAATRRTLNVTVAAQEFVASEAVNGEAHWATVDRLLVELAFLRAWTGSPVRRGE
jgi:transposase-like protein